MEKPVGLTRRTLFVTVAASSLLTACGGSGTGGGSGANSLADSFNAATAVAPVLPDAASAPSLAAKFPEFKVGFAIDPWIAADPQANAIVTKHASSVTAETAMTANSIGVSAGVYDFSQADAIVNFARSRGLTVRGNNLVSFDSTPAWFFAGNPASANYKATVQARLETYVTDVVTHFKGQVAAWDVVNAAASDDASSNYRNSQWFQVLGPDYIAVAFAPRAPRILQPNCSSTTTAPKISAKLGRLMAIVNTMKTAGVPLDGVGHQLHLDVSVPVSAVANALGTVAASGLINHVTQLDISVYLDPGSRFGTPGEATQVELNGGNLIVRQAAQARLYRDLYSLFASAPSVKSVTTWGTDDTHSWLNTSPITRPNYALLFDRAGNPKADFWAVVDPTFPV